MDQHWDPIDVEELSQGGGGGGSSSFLADSFHAPFDVRYLNAFFCTLRTRERSSGSRVHVLRTTTVGVNRVDWPYMPYIWHEALTA